MASDDSAAIDPEVLADPVRDDSDSAEGRSTALVPAPERGLAPFDPLRRYLAEARKYPPLSREEEQALARLYQETGDREALFRLITANLMLVVRIAMSFRRAAKNVLDLIQEGNVGLMEAIERFNPDLDVRLPTYAAWWVRAYMVKFLLDNVRLVRVGTTNARRKLLRNLRKEKARLEAEGFEVGPKLLAERFGVSEEDVVEVEKALNAHDVSIDAPVGEDGERDGSQFLPSSEPSVEDSVARRELQARVEAAIERFRVDLGDRELALLDERILAEDPKTLQAIGDRFGVTREAMRQAEGRLKNRLKKHLSDALGELGSVRIGPA